MTKTKKDLMLATYGLIFDQTNPTGMKDFKRYALPHLLRQCPSLSEPLTDEEFDRELQKIRDNLPEIIEYLRRRPLSAALTPDNNEINPPVNSKDILNFPPGDFVIGDDGRGERILAKLGLLKFMNAPPPPRGAHDENAVPRRPADTPVSPRVPRRLPRTREKRLRDFRAMPAITTIRPGAKGRR